MYRSYEKLDKSEETKGLVYMYSLTFTRKKKQQTTNLARIWHSYLCPSPRPPPLSAPQLSDPLSGTGKV